MTQVPAGAVPEVAGSDVRMISRYRRLRRWSGYFCGLSINNGDTDIDTDICIYIYI